MLVFINHILMSSSECLQRLFITDTTGFFTFPNLPTYFHSLGCTKHRQNDGGPGVLPTLNAHNCCSVIILYSFLYILYVVAGIIILPLYLVLMCVAILVIGVGYSVAYIFHMASFGSLFRFEEFSQFSCFVGYGGSIVDKGGPDGMGYSDGKNGISKIIFLPTHEVGY